MADINTVTDSTRIQRLFPHLYKKLIPDALKEMCNSLYRALGALEESIQQEIVDVTNGKHLDDTEDLQSENLNAKGNSKTQKKKKKGTKGHNGLQAKEISIAQNVKLQRDKGLQKLDNSLQVCHEDGTLLRNLNAELSPASNLPTLPDATIHALLSPSVFGFAESIPLESASNIIPPEFIPDINHMIQVTETWTQANESALTFLEECKKETLNHITESNETIGSVDKGIRAICDEATGSMHVVVSAASLRSTESRLFNESVKAEIMDLNKAWARELSGLKSEVSDLDDMLAVPHSTTKALEQDRKMVENYFVASVMTQDVLESDEKPIGVLAAIMVRENALKALEDIYQGQLLKGSKECV
ncbi:hypothetical protein FPCIR_9930 [Fusarium pseudocircinatum]|uniref:Uncharacterized protein n=1 Tax=Fusarium pseudocircinatum TaxID=56676 RepID=A0A8H5KYZ0_9HYPO|nr:hypothetical protein FPCIR_9930 [Fusarium pseudocircinatum]